MEGGSLTSPLPPSTSTYTPASSPQINATFLISLQIDEIYSLSPNCFQILCSSTQSVSFQITFRFIRPDKTMTTDFKGTLLIGVNKNKRVDWMNRKR